jgi:hypothetical protein
MTDTVTSTPVATMAVFDMISPGVRVSLRLSNALVQLQAQYNHCGEAASPIGVKTLYWAI